MTFPTAMSGSRFIIPGDIMSKMAIDLMHLQDHLILLAQALYVMETAPSNDVLNEAMHTAQFAAAIETTLRIVIEESSIQGVKNGTS